MSLSGHLCHVCGNPCQFTCSGCETAYYCSASCQRAHWGSHKPSCKKIQRELQEGGNANVGPVLEAAAPPSQTFLFARAESSYMDGFDGDADKIEREKRVALGTRAIGGPPPKGGSAEGRFSPAGQRGGPPPPVSTFENLDEDAPDLGLNSPTKVPPHRIGGSGSGGGGEPTSLSFGDGRLYAEKVSDEAENLAHTQRFGGDEEIVFEVIEGSLVPRSEVEIRLRREMAKRAQLQKLRESRHNMRVAALASVRGGRIEDALGHLARVRGLAHQQRDVENELLSTEKRDQEDVEHLMHQHHDQSDVTRLPRDRFNPRTGAAMGDYRKKLAAKSGSKADLLESYWESAVTAYLGAEKAGHWVHKISREQARMAIYEVNRTTSALTKEIVGVSYRSVLPMDIEGSPPLDDASTSGSTTAAGGYQPLISDQKQKLLPTFPNYLCLAGELNFCHSNFGEAEQWYLANLRYALHENEKDSVQVAEALNELAAFYFVAGRFLRALDVAFCCHAIRSRTPNWRLAETQTNIGMLHQLSGRFAKAIEMLDEASKLRFDLIDRAKKNTAVIRSSAGLLAGNPAKNFLNNKFTTRAAGAWEGREGIGTTDAEQQLGTEAAREHEVWDVYYRKAFAQHAVSDSLEQYMSLQTILRPLYSYFRRCSGYLSQKAQNIAKLIAKVEDCIAHPHKIKSEATLRGQVSMSGPRDGNIYDKAIAQIREDLRARVCKKIFCELNSYVWVCKRDAYTHSGGSWFRGVRSRRLLVVCVVGTSRGRGGADVHDTIIRV